MGDFTTASLLRRLSNYPVSKSDVLGHEFHGNQHTGGIGGGGTPRQSDPGRNRVSADRFQAPKAEAPTGTTGPRPEIKPEGDSKEELKAFATSVIGSLQDGNQPVLQSDDYVKFLAAMENVPKGTEAEEKMRDIERILIDDTILMGQGGMHVPRIEMPQIPDEERPQFLADIARENGVNTTEERVDPTTLKPWQSEISAAGAAYNFRSNPDGIPDEKRILISKDGYIIDGHHTWAAAVGLKFLNGSDLPVYRLSITGKEAIDLSNKWATEHGHEHVGMGQAAAVTKAIIEWLVHALRGQ